MGFFFFNNNKKVNNFVCWARIYILLKMYWAPLSDEKIEPILIFLLDSGYISLKL